MKKLKSIISIALMGVMLMGIMSFLFGCFGDDTVPRYGDPWKYKKEDQGFYYAVYSKDGTKTATVLGLVDEELERDELVIPEKLGGISVTQIGAIYQQLSVSNKYYGINAKNITKIVISHELKLFSEGILYFTGNLMINAKVNLSRMDNLKDVNEVQFNTDITLIEDYAVFMTGLVEGYKNFSEVIFNAILGKQTTYAIITKNENMLILKNNPTRNNFIFAGWYKDKDYTSKWNFEEDKVTENITLYAKWLTMEE